MSDGVTSRWRPQHSSRLTPLQASKDPDRKTIREGNHVSSVNNVSTLRPESRFKSSKTKKVGTPAIQQ